MFGWHILRASRYGEDRLIAVPLGKGQRLRIQSRCASWRPSQAERWILTGGRARRQQPPGTIVVPPEQLHGARIERIS